jgi:NAD-dependent oxidoreductase involved in siderophore biosynthesis
MKARKFLRDTIKLVESEGARVVEATTSARGHYKLICEYNGRRFHFHVAGSPSDYRTAMNDRADLRRRIREASA